MSQSETDAALDAPKSRLLSFLRGTTKTLILDNFDGIFISLVFIVIGGLLSVSSRHLAYVNFFFVPVLMAAYFLSMRTAMAGAGLALAWTTLLVYLHSAEIVANGRMSMVASYLLLWGGTMVLIAALVGRLSEELRSRSQRARDNSGQLSELQAKLEEAGKALETKSLSLQRVESVLYSTMDPIVAKMIIDRKLRNEKRKLTVLFADLKDFTRHSEEMGPELVIEDLNRMFSAMEPIFSLYRGHFDKYIGDGLMAEFGVPYPAQHHELLAVLAATKMQEKMRAGSFPWPMRIGIASGPSLVGLMGSDNRKHFTAIGDTVNLASRLQVTSPEGGMCVDENVYEAVRRWFNLQRVSGHSAAEAKELEGKLELVQKTIQHAPSAKLYLEAAHLVSELGDSARAAEYFRAAQELDPRHRDPVDEAIHAAMLTGRERGTITVKGRKQRVAAYEVLGLRDPFDDRARIPPQVAACYREMAAKSNAPWEALLAIEAIDGSIGHGKVSAALAVALADAIGLDERQKRMIFYAAYVHDIGKKHVPEHLLNHESNMAELPFSDQAVIKSHVREAKKVLEGLGLPVSPEVVETIYQHHERCDGSGYPEGLKESQISLAARVLMIADAYEVRTSWRPFQDPWEPKAALAEIRSDMAEKRFDHRIGQVFLKMMGE